MSPTQIILFSAVRLYRWVLSPAKTALFGSLGRCRFTPTCSQYALEAIQQHGSGATAATTPCRRKLPDSELQIPNPAFCLPAVCEMK
ncbi:MAG: hypothetical protein DME23_16410 [Verrucomicrobia bacterium]|nr:MAG: hypothetical protein DME23_16410 [Verrucomicrobiota bacterium]